MCRGELAGNFCSPAKCWVGQVPVDVPHEVEIQRQVQVPVPVTRQVPALFPQDLFSRCDRSNPNWAEAHS